MCKRMEYRYRGLRDIRRTPYHGFCGCIQEIHSMTTLIQHRSGQPN